MSERANPAILRVVAERALDDARAAWRAARAASTEDAVRAAFRGCVFASRALRRAAPFFAGERDSMVATADRADAAASALLHELVAIREAN